MRCRTGAAALGMALLAVTAAEVAQAAPAKKPAPPPAKPAVKGTTQLAGDNGQIGITYTVGKSTPLNFTLTEAEYTITRVNEGDNPIAPQADQKLLVLRFTAQNPNKYETACDWGSLRFTVVDAANNNHDAETVLHAETGQRLGISLKPAQKVPAVAVLRVPARGEVPKLIVERHPDEPVLRYDLRGKDKPLPAPFAAPEDLTGATARTEVPAEAGQYYPFMQFDGKLVSAAYVDSALGEHEPGEGNRFLVVTFSLRNGGRAKVGYDWGTFTATLRAADGEKTDTLTVLKSARDQTAGGELDPGEETTVRMVFELPRDIGAQSVTIAEGESRSYRFDLKL